MNQYLVDLYKPFPITVERSERIYIYDSKGKKYIDTFSGIGVLAFGHSNEEIKRAMKEKIDRYTHLSNYFTDPDAIEVAKMIVERTGRRGKVFYGNSGTEANEAALKAIKKRKGKILSFSGNFHGRTIGSLSITGFDNLSKPFLPLIEDVDFLPFGDSKAFEDYMSKRGSDVSAVFVETLLGSGGLKMIDDQFAKKVMESKEKYKYILVADEVQSGLGRTGKFYAHEHFNIKPDIITVAKSIGGGLPLSATIFLDEYSDMFSQGEHGSTFGPNPVALAAAKVVLSKLNAEFIDEVREKGEYFKRNLSVMPVKEVRGVGLMIGVEIPFQSKDIIAAGLKNDLLLNVVNGNTVRFLPPLDISYEEMNEILERFEKTLEALKNGLD
ncbi:aspartate aminotransferase family protein [Athalassotoga saccharophila]|uniref:aspartate aminotransferase family protein n=1 Tax=Athalassotoga saccharophila TaxID=1441386 RepID=UPI00137B4E2B|nr:aspartate aminotransferase family protein [Athalassotoga saccharophila]BBJ28619.1 acetylornithine aminotransferase [Athalassotoga saccharophila]